MSSTKCFFIDDDEDDRNFFCEAMEQIAPAIECFFAKDGRSAITFLMEDHTFVPDFIFMDMNMPMMDGNECLHFIKSIQRLKDIPTYIYSTAASNTVINRALALGARDFLIKPSNMSELKSTLKQIVMPEIDGHHALNALRMA